jgi:hypothetical protein
MSRRRVGFRYDNCPEWLKRCVKEWAAYSCEGMLYADGKGLVLQPYTPTPKDPEPLGFVGCPSLWVPQSWGQVFDYRPPRYPEICFKWVCGRSLYDCGTVDRFIPRHAGGVYDVMNVGALCVACNALKRQRWPWVDYRSDCFKRNREDYLRGKHGSQLWLWSL